MDGIEWRKRFECTCPRYFARPLSRSTFFQRKLRGLAKTCYERHRESPRPEPAFMPPPVHDRLQWKAPEPATPHDQGTDAFGSVDLVAANANQVDARDAKRLNLLPKRLSGIDVEEGIGPS